MKNRKRLLVSCLASFLLAGNTAFDALAAVGDDDTAVAGIAVSLNQYYEQSDTPEADILDYLRPLAASSQEKAQARTVSVKVKSDGKSVFTETRIEEGQSVLETGIVSVVGYLNVRSIPSLEGTIIGYLYNNGKVEIYETVGEGDDLWYLIKSGDVEGYISADYVLTGAQAEEAAQENGYAQAFALTDELVKQKLESYRIDINFAKSVYAESYGVGDYRAAYNAITYAYELLGYYVADASNAGYDELAAQARAEQIQVAEQVKQAEASLNGTTPSQTPQTDPAAPQTQPSKPSAESEEPSVKPSEPEAEPSESQEPEAEPSKPETEPSESQEPEAEPSKPEAEPSEPASAPSESEAPPTESEEPSTEPETEPSEPASVPSESEAPTESEEPSTEPETPPSEPASAPSESETPPTEPEEPSTEPEIPPSEPASAPSESEAPPTEPEVPSTEPQRSMTGIEAAYAGSGKLAGEILQGSEISVLAVYSDGTRETISEGWGCDLVGAALGEGSHTVTVYYGSFSSSFILAVSPAPTESEEPPSESVHVPVSNPSTPLRDSLVAYACSFAGNCSYQWAGADLSIGGAVDCSGFTMCVYRDIAGVSLDHYTGNQINQGAPVSYEQLRPGDLVFYPGHVAIYIGNDTIVHAANETAGIRYDNLFYNQSIGYRTYLP